MRKIFTFLLSVLFVTSLLAQEASINQTFDPPVVGGDIDAAWDQADPESIEKIYIGSAGLENPTLGEPGESYWKGLWDYDGIYLLVYAADDTYAPFYDRVDQEDTGNPHTYDQVEVFLDVNAEKDDGGGGRYGNDPGTTGWGQDGEGHYQLAPVGADGNNAVNDDAEVHTYVNGVFTYEYSINKDAYAPNWFYEYFIPWSSLLDKDEKRGYAYDGFGFEVVIDDNDTGLKDDRNRIVWANEENGEDDSWDNMDEAGTLLFNDFEVIYADEIILTGEDITADGQTTTIEVEMISEEPGIPVTDPSITWHIVADKTTAKYKWDADTRELTALSDGTFTIYAEDATGWVFSNELTITIENQILTLDEANYIVDGYNENPQEDNSPNAAWLDGPGNDYNGIWGHTAYVEDGVFYFKTDSVLEDTYFMKVIQEVDIAYEDKDLNYVARWKMWAAEETSFPLRAEDGNQSWALWTVPDSLNHTDNIEVDGNQWIVTATTEPQWYEVHFTAANMIENTARTYFGFHVGLTAETMIALDSMYLISEDAADIIDWDWNGVEQNILTQETLNVYPNPATDVLNVTLSAPNSKVAIYNSVGVKVEETVVDGNMHTFDVSGYSPGLYFVRTNNAVAKFVK